MASTSRMRRADGRPGAQLRVLAALVALGLLSVVAPFAVYPLVDWLGHL